MKNKNKIFFAAFLVLAISIFACAKETEIAPSNPASLWYTSTPTTENTPLPTLTITPLPTLESVGNPATQIATPTSESFHITITAAQSVYLHSTDMKLTGAWLTNGSELTVNPYQDGWYQIIGGEYAGDLIWSGCTSLNENRTCQSK